MVVLRRITQDSATYLHTLRQHSDTLDDLTMRPPERLYSDRLDFRPVTGTDANSIFQVYAGEAAATRFMNFKRHQSIAETQAFTTRCETCWRDGSAFPWALIERRTGKLIGVIEIRWSPPKADFGYILGQQHWGCGYGSEAAKALVGWAVEQPEIYRIWATCHPENRASTRVLVKAGLRFEATLANWESRPQLGEVAGSSDCYVLTKNTP